MRDQFEEEIKQIQVEQDIFQKAKLLEYLQKKKQIPLHEISKKLNIKPSYLCHIIRLNRIPDLIKDGYYSKLISISHLFIVSRLKDAKLMYEVYEQILKQNFTVFQTEEKVRELLYGIRTNGHYLPKTPFPAWLQEFLKKNPDISIQVIQSRVKGKIIVTIKGSLGQTTSSLELIIKSLQSWILHRKK